MNQPSLEYFVIAAYLALMIAIGIVFKNFSKSPGDYFRGNSRGTWWIVGMSSFMAGISANTFTGNGGLAFDVGWSILFIYIANCIGLAFHVFFLAPWFRQFRATTFPEVLRARFGPMTQQVYACVWMPVFLLTAAVWLLGLAVYASTTFGLPIGLVIPVLGLVVLFYSTTGGKWAVMAADFVQGLIMMGMTILVAILCLMHFGGPGGLLDAIGGAGLDAQFTLIKPGGAYPKQLYTWEWAIAIGAIQIVNLCSLQSGAKYFAVKDGGEARRAAVLTLVLMAAGTLLWFIPPVTGRLLFADEILASGMPKPAEAAFAVVSAKFLPAGLVGMMVVAMFSATMSSMDAGLNGNAAIFVKDMLPALCRRLRRPPPGETAQLWLGRVVTMSFGVVIIVLALAMSRLKSGHGVFEIALQISAVLVLPMTLPLLLCLFIKKVPHWSAVFSIAATIVPSTLATFSGSDYWNLQHTVFWVFVTGAAAFLLTRLFWRAADAEYRKQVDMFFATMRRPVDFAGEVGEGNDGRQLVIMGRFTLAIAAFTALLLAVPNPPAGRAAIAALSVVLAAIGALLVWSGRRKGGKQ
jgi:Na+/proline symporter